MKPLLTKENISKYNNQIHVIRILHKALRSDLKFPYEFNRRELKRLLQMANRGLSHFFAGKKFIGADCVSAFSKPTKNFGTYYTNLEKYLNINNIQV